MWGSQEDEGVGESCEGEVVEGMGQGEGELVGEDFFGLEGDFFEVEIWSERFFEDFYEGGFAGA